jgi:hypothetical protein
MHRYILYGLLTVLTAGIKEHKKYLSAFGQIFFGKRLVIQPVKSKKRYMTDRALGLHRGRK